MDAAVGGGGVIQIPTFMTAYPNLHPSSVLSTNKAASVIGTAYAGFKIRKKCSIHIRSAVYMCVITAVTSYCGALVAPKIPPVILEAAVGIALLSMLVTVYFKVDFGEASSENNSSLKYQYPVAALIGIYDGVLGPGLGLLAVLLFVQVVRQGYIKSLLLSKILNVTSNLFALFYFAPAGYVVWHIAGIMFVANLIGSICGVILILKYGAVLFRKLFLLSSVAMIVKYVFDLAIQ
ncbi:hypothetical protein BTW10_15205 [Chromohalobacter japonicus]|uniref:Probable membrane transporter protein n=2 Tax=Chromohalobacter japonicus TaxID=223900 RepID=A0A1Q8T9J5_9GAMM|nr:hypothetical protein BTW10_15205 [Chromohalobacter japonicus]